MSDPLNTVTGNPGLSPSNDHNFYFGFNSFDFQKGTGLYISANGNFTNDQVISRTTIDDNFVRNTTFDNVDGNYRIYGNINYSKSVKVDTL